MIRPFPALAMLALAACKVHSADDVPPEPRVSICEPLAFEDTPFTHCVAVPGEHAIGMDVAPEGSSEPYHSLAAYAETVGEDAEAILLVMNGGMFDGQGQPIGYYVEDGRRLVVLNQNDGPGNFHLMPNGVFYGESAEGPWHVIATQDFARDVNERPNFATQSGPMLVIDGELHPLFDQDGDSRKVRNAVGIDASGRAHFIISRAPVSFGKIARLYRDVLRTENALFLDGTVSQMWDVPRDRMDTGPAIGPLIIVTEREDQ